MSASVVTRVEAEHSTVYVEVTDGRVSQLQFDPATEAEHDRVVAAIQSTLSRALGQHSKEVVAALMSGASTSDPAQQRVLDFVEEQLKLAVGAVIPPPTDWAPGQADGRDASRLFHVAVADLVVVELDVPRGALASPYKAGQAICEALNQALARIDSDYNLPSVEVAPPEQLDWAALAVQIERNRRGY